MTNTSSLKKWKKPIPTLAKLYRRRMRRRFFQNPPPLPAAFIDKTTEASEQVQSTSQQADKLAVTFSKPSISTKTTKREKPGKQLRKGKRKRRKLQKPQIILTSNGLLPSNTYIDIPTKKKKNAQMQSADAILLSSDSPPHSSSPSSSFFISSEMSQQYLTDNEIFPADSAPLIGMPKLSSAKNKHKTSKIVANTASKNRSKSEASSYTHARSSNQDLPTVPALKNIPSSSASRSLPPKRAVQPAEESFRFTRNQFAPGECACEEQQIALKVIVDRMDRLGGEMITFQNPINGTSDWYVIL